MQSIATSRQEHADKIIVFVDSDFAGDPLSRKNSTGLVAQMGNQTVKSGSTLQSFWRGGVLRSDERMSSWTILEIYVPRSWNSNEDRNTKWQFDGEFFDGSIGSRTANARVSFDREHRDGCASWVKPVNGGQVWALLTMNGGWQQWQEAMQAQGATQWHDAARNFCEHCLTPNLARTLMMTETEQMLFDNQAVVVHASMQLIVWTGNS